ncbi:hypothetical protein ACQT3V_00440 [Brucella sp. NF 2653]|uniref:hypothetical protein n=1 Tax=Brucella sp. NF 2653 TaxID=693748 RepID=UPI003D09D7E3
MTGKHVAVLMGGFSSERSVSLSSGAACATTLEECGYRVTRIDVDRNVASILAELKPDVVFNALHGPFGKDGAIQGVLEYLQIPTRIPACWLPLLRWTRIAPRRWLQRRASWLRRHA